MRFANYAFFLSLAAVGANAAVTVKVDRFTESTSYGTTLRPVYSHLTPITTASKDKDGKLDINIVLMGAFENWTYLRCHDTHWLLDGKPVNLPPALHHGEVVSGGVVEDIIQKIPVYKPSASSPPPARSNGKCATIRAR